jgi:hypothetical protein
MPMDSPFGKWVAIEIIDGMPVAVSFGSTKNEAMQNLRTCRERKAADNVDKKPQRI